MTMKNRTEIPATLAKVFADAQLLLKPPKKQTVSQWAEEKRYLSGETSAIPGLWRNDVTPYLTEIMDSFTDPSVSRIVLVSSSQIGKTEFELNCIGYLIDNDPCPIILTMPTLDDVKKTSKTRIAPMIRTTPSLREKVSRIKSRDSDNTTLEKAFPGGFIKMTGSNAPAALASTPARVILGDEVDRWAVSAGTEGDPWGLLEARTISFYNRKMIEVSTPTVKGASRIASDFELGTQERWCVQCPDCGEWHNIVFNDIKFEFETGGDGKKKTYNVTSVLWKCPGCGCVHTEGEIRQQPFKWIAANPEAIELRGCRSFWLNAFVSPWLSWDDIVMKFLDARDDPIKLQTVFNTYLGELWEDRGELPDEGRLLARRETYPAELPDGVLALTCGVDTQGDRLEYEVVGWGRYGESWGIKRGIIDGKADTPEVWERLDDLVDHIYRFQNGKGLKIMRTYVDSGGLYTQEVYQRCRERQPKRVFAIKGVAGDNRPFSPPGKPCTIMVNKKYLGQCKLHLLGVDSGKAIIMSALRVQEPGANYCHFPLGEERGYNEAFFFGLLSERPVLSMTKTGKQRAQYPAYYKATDFQSQYGRRVHDCIGLIKGYLWRETSESNPKYCAAQDVNVGTMLSRCTEKGKIASIPELPGVLVFMSGHVGVYIGGGYVIEARGHKYGVVKTALSARPWKNWGKCPWITYSGTTVAKTTSGGVNVTLPIIKLGSKSNSVKAVQRLLNAMGYKGADSRTLSVDGDCGANTIHALKL